MHFLKFCLEYTGDFHPPNPVLCEKVFRSCCYNTQPGRKQQQLWLLWAGLLLLKDPVRWHVGFVIIL